MLEHVKVSTKFIFQRATKAGFSGIFMERSKSRHFFSYKRKAGAPSFVGYLFLLGVMIIKFISHYVSKLVVRKLWIWWLCFRSYIWFLGVVDFLFCFEFLLSRRIYVRFSVEGRFCLLLWKLGTFLWFSVEVNPCCSLVLTAQSCCSHPWN